MIFNPGAVFSHFAFFLGVLTIILLLKPLVAFLIVILLNRPIKTAVIVAVALAQIGEFSFILSEQAMNYNILSDEGYDILVACALISIAINPFYFRACDPLTKWIAKRTKSTEEGKLKQEVIKLPRAIIVGFGPVGQEAAKMLDQLGVTPVIIDTNVDTVIQQRHEHRETLFGDASGEHILKTAHVATAKMLVITTPEIATTVSIIHTARSLNKDILIIARALYGSDKYRLTELKVVVVCDEEETRRAFTRTLAAL